MVNLTLSYVSKNRYIEWETIFDLLLIIFFPSSKPVDTIDYCLAFFVQGIAGYDLVRDNLPGLLRSRLMFHLNNLSLDFEA